MKRKFAKIMAAALCIALACAPVGCASSGGGSGSPASKDNAIEVWSAPVTEKIVGDKEFADKGEAKLAIEMYANETEGAQIVLTPEKDIESFTVELSPLSGPDGATIPVSAMKLYLQKQIQVRRLTRPGSPFSPGMYPDAMLPFDAAEAAGENAVAAGNNQAVTLEVTTPADQKPGTYTGSAKIIADGKTISVPVSVTVWDWALPAENHLRTVFSIPPAWGDGGFYQGELDTTWDLYTKYYEFLASFRVSPRYLPYTINGGRSNVDKVVECMVKYAKDPMITTWVLPYINTSSGIDEDYHDEVITKMMTASLKNHINLFEKTVTYFAAFDEANGNSTKMTLARNTLAFVRDYAAAFDGKHDFTDDEGNDLKETKEYAEYLKSMQDITQLFVGYYTAGSFFDENFTREEYHYQFCPTVNRYGSAEERGIYHKAFDEYASEEYWWYTCVSPKNPYPSYHIDDWGYSPRMLSWMQYKYDVVGNLYWATTLWAESDNGSSFTHLDNVYDVAMQFPGANGDGFLFYPGKPYDIDGPVASLRLHAIRDGMEDYEALYALGSKYAEILDGTEITADVNDALAPVYDSLFQGTTISTTSEKVDVARRAVAEILTAAELTDVAIIDGKASGSDRVFRIFAPTGSTVTAENMTSEDAMNGGEKVGTIYTVTADNSVDNAVFEFTATKGDKTAKVTVPLGAKRTAFNDEQFIAGLTLNTGDTAAAVDGGGTKITIAAGSNGRVRFISDAFKKLDLSTLLMSIEFENTGSTKLEISLSIKGSKSNTLESIGQTIVLEPGEVLRDAQFDLTGINWTVSGELEYIRFTIGCDNAGGELVIRNVLFTE